MTTIQYNEIPSFIWGGRRRPSCANYLRFFFNRHIGLVLNTDRTAKRRYTGPHLR